MRKAIVLLVVAMLFVPLLLVAAGCGEESAEDAKKELCQNLQELEAALTSLMDISLQSSLDDLQAKQSAVEGAWDDVVASASKVADAQIKDLQDAVENLNNTIESLSSDTTIAEALELITVQISQVESAWAALIGSLDCDEIMNE